MHYLTLSMDNRFSFTCPIFNTDVEMRGCVMVRDKVYKGEQFSQRRGCQACVTGGKCPAAHIVQQIAFRRSDATDHCSSAEPKTGKLPAEHLERVRAVVLTDGTLQRFALNASELKLIETANDRIDQQIKTAPRGAVSGRIQTYSAPTPAKTARKAPVAAQKAAGAVSAASSGDLSAAINS